MNRSGPWSIMRSRSRVWLAVPVAIAAAALSLAFLSSPALADDTALGGVAGDYYPLTSTDVRMESETVQAVCYRHFAEYRADFLFVNTGQPKTVLLGFPFEVEVEGDGWAGPVGFRAWQDGKPLAVTLGQGPDTWQRYYLHEAAFPTGRTMISVAYLANPTVTAGTRFAELMPPQFAAIPGISAWDASYDYWLHTGAGWAGTIRTAVVRFTLADDFRGYGIDVRSDYQSPDGLSGYITTPPTYTKIDGSTYQWLFKDLEPTEGDDVRLGFSPLFLNDGAAAVPAVMGAVVNTVSTSNPPATTTDPWDVNWPLLDGSPNSSLALGGLHPWVKLGIQGDTKIGEIRIVTGDNESLETFGQHGRPKTVKITLSDGTTATVTLADEPSVQKFPISGTADWVRLDVIDSYPGTAGGDVYISDVSFGSRPAPAFQPFDTLLAAAADTSPGSTAPSTAPTAAPGTPSTVPATVEPGTTEAGALVTTPSPAVTPASPAPAGGPAASQGRVVVDTWPIVLFVIAGIALVAVAVLTVLLIKRKDRAA